MANRKEFELAIKIAGMIDQSLNTSCNLTKKQLRDIAQQAATTNKTVTGFGPAMNTMGDGIDKAWNVAGKAVKTTAVALTAATGAAVVAGAAIINTGSDFESAFAGVRKTVDATEQQFEDLEEGLRLMSKNKPQTAVELAEIAEAAGQLGIHTENIEDFTSTMADLKVATNLGDEGAEQFAKFANIVQMSQDKFENLGSAIVDLGNNTATTERDIMAMSMRVAGAGHQVGMSEADILGFSAALSSVGIEAEAGGSAISKVMINMQLAVEKGGGSLAQFAKVSGMSSKEFKKAFKEDAAGAISAFITGLNDTDRLGQSAIAILDDMDIKEVRLRDTLLRGANASELFRNTLDLSTKAFEENTALTKEAEQRYKTFESRVQMADNRIKDIGITLYQDFRDPLSDALGVAMKFADELSVLDHDYIKGLADNFQKSIPTMVRNLGTAKNTVQEFAAPIIEMGDWMIENPDVIAGTLIGIGTAITGLKLAKTVNEVATALNAMRLAVIANPVTAVIGLTALAGGAIVGLSTKITMAEKELKKKDLAKHFGNISLSIDDLDEAAKNILGNENRKNLELFTDQLRELDKVTGKIEEHQRTLEKLNWKISMGIELTEEDRKGYTAAINGYTESLIQGIEEQHYTATVAVNTLFAGEGGDGIISSLDQFYNSAEEEIRAAGKKLGEEYEKAMEDGIVSPIEQETIETLTKNLQQIQERVMESKRLAKWDVMAVDYLNGGRLDSESFLNLQDRITAQQEEDMNVYKNAFEETLATNTRIYDAKISDPNATEFDKRMAREEKQAADANAEEQYRNRRVETNTRAMDFTQDILKQQYPEVAGQLGDFKDYINSFMSESLRKLPEDWAAGSTRPFEEAMFMIKNNPNISQASKDAMKDILKGMEPQVDDMREIAKSYEEQGKEIPESIAKGLSEYELMKAITGDENSIMNILDAYLTTSPEALAVFDTAEGAGGWVAGSMGNGIEKNSLLITNAIDKVADDAEKKLQSRFGNMTVYGDIDFEMNVGSVTTRQSATANPNAGRGGTKHAEGGIFNTPHYGVFAEAGPEAFIPIDGSQNAKSIWRQVGEMMGLLDPGMPALSGMSSTAAGAGSFSTETNQNRSGSQIVYSPTYQIHGSSIEDIKKATSDDYTRFKTFMQQYDRDKARLSF